jgi:hypothetical protein
MKSLSKIRATAGRSGAESRWGISKRESAGRISAHDDVCVMVKKLPIETRVAIVSNVLRDGLPVFIADRDSVAVDDRA